MVPFELKICEIMKWEIKPGFAQLQIVCISRLADITQHSAKSNDCNWLLKINCEFENYECKRSSLAMCSWKVNVASYKCCKAHHCGMINI